MQYQHLEKLWSICLEEDHASNDFTSKWVVPEDARSEAKCIPKQQIVFSGLSLLNYLKELYASKLDFVIQAKDGAHYSNYSELFRVSGPSQLILPIERSLLNILMQICGVASHAAKILEELPEIKGRLRDTRKGHPGLRILEKEAVIHGGLSAHRYHLSDGVLIKENHIKAAGGLKKALENIQKNRHHLLAIELEVETIDEIKLAQEYGIEWLLLDNFSSQKLEEALKIKGSTKYELSGNLCLEKLKPLVEIKEIDAFSMGSLVYGAKWADLSLLFV